MSPNGAVLNSSSSDYYHQKALEGHKKHDFSPKAPPRPGHNIYGHWTPYQPPDPATYPANARKHVVVKGDTLWDISGKYYKDNYLWPQIWDANPWVTYPHWIYPGDVLLIASLMVLPEGHVEDQVKIPSIHEGFFLASGSDAVYCGHFVADPNHKFSGQILQPVEDPSPILLTTNDLVYINVGAKDGVLPGDEFAICYPAEHYGTTPSEIDNDRDFLRHPVTGEKLGNIMKMAGRLKVVLLGEAVSTARIVHACDGIEPGFHLYPFTETPIPLVRRKERETLVNEVPKRGRGFIVWLADREILGGPGQLMTIDLGSRQGVMPGDVFRIYRDEPSTRSFFSPNVEHLGDFWDFHEAKRAQRHLRPITEKSVYGRQRDFPQTPPHLVGTIVVLYTEDDTATARGLDGPVEFYAGDRIVYEPVDTGLDSVPMVEGSTYGQ